MICTLCPRNCGAERAPEHGTGVCRMGTLPKIARAALHRWEEPCISGTRGSGAVFFSGCGLRCVFCQNESISQRGEGKIVTPKRLSEIFRELEAQGAHNINLVTAAHFVPAVLDALALYRPNIPIVYNSSGYESVETLRMLEGAVDIYLPDYKYIDPNMAAMLSGARRGFAIQGRGDRLPVDVLQKYLDQACGEKSGWSLDYVHGDADAAGLAQSGATAALLGAMDKRALFPAIAAGGVLPRKTFSMGEATEKRYYMECRRIDAKNP